MASNLIVCKQCGTPFNTTAAGSKLCPNCVQKYDDGFARAARFLGSQSSDKHIENMRTMEDFANETKVEPWILLDLLRRKRIALPKPLEGGVVCQFCRAPIATGDVCVDCGNKLAQELMASKSKNLSPLNPNSAKRR